MECAHCHAELRWRHWRFCGSSCRQAAYRRRRRGLAEDALAGAGRRGRVPLAGKTRAELVDALGEIHATLAGAAAAYQLLDKNRHLAEAVRRLEAIDVALAEDHAEAAERMGSE